MAPHEPMLGVVQPRQASGIPPPPAMVSCTPIPADATAAAGVQGGKHDDGGVVSGPAAHQRLEALRVQADDMAPVAEVGHLLPSLAQGELRITARRGLLMVYCRYHVTGDTIHGHLTCD